MMPDWRTLTDRQMKEMHEGWWNAVRLRLGVFVIGEPQFVARLEGWHRLREAGFDFGDGVLTDGIREAENGN